MQNDLKKLFEKIKEINVLKYNLLNKTKIFFIKICFVSFVKKEFFRQQLSEYLFLWIIDIL